MQVCRWSTFLLTCSICLPCFLQTRYLQTILISKFLTIPSPHETIYLSGRLFFLSFFSFWLRWVLVVARRIYTEACGIFSLWRAGFSPVAARGLLSSGLLSSCGVQVFLSLVVACGLQSMRALQFCGTWALSLRRESSVVVARGPSCPAACGILVPRPGIEPAPPALEGGFFTTGPPGKSHVWETFYH